jgi:hypothetical protein
MLIVFEFKSPICSGSFGLGPAPAMDSPDFGLTANLIVC